jgi:hypothetical protein
VDIKLSAVGQSGGDDDDNVVEMKRVAHLPSISKLCTSNAAKRTSGSSLAGPAREYLDGYRTSSVGKEEVAWLVTGEAKLHGGVEQLQRTVRPDRRNL